MTYCPLERCDIVGVSANRIGVDGVGDRYRTHRCGRPRATSERHALFRARSEHRSSYHAGTDARARAGRPTTDWPQAF